MKANIFKRAMAVVSTIAVVAAGLTPFAGTNAASNWGPDRPSYTYNGPGTAGADHVVFNSFTNNPNVGDERIFFSGKDATNTADGGFQDTINVQPDGTYLLRIYVHNNADPSLNGANLDGAGVARNTTVRVALPTTTDRSLRANAFISASNAVPGTIFDSTDFQTTGATGFSLAYVPGSATIANNASPSGRPVADSIVTTGAPIGYATNDGNFPGCFQYDSFVTLKVKVVAPKLTVTKQVQIAGSGLPWQSQITAKSGDTVSWLVTVTNNSTLTDNNMTVRDQLPPHVTLVPGSVLWFDAANPNGTKQSDTQLFTSGGINFGNYAANGGGFFIRYRTTVNNDFTVCGSNVINNNVFVKADNVQEVAAAAGLTVEKTCVVPQCTQNCTPVTPPTTPLPQTGAESGLAGAMGITGIGYSLRSYLRSKRSLLDSLRK